MQTEGNGSKVVPIRNGIEVAHPLPPAQYNLFSEKPDVLPVLVDHEGEEELRVSEDIVLARTADASQLVLSGFGLFLSKKGERLLVKKRKDLLYEFPFYRLSEVTVASRGITLSSDLIMELCERGIQINFLHGTGRPYAKITAPSLSATIQARREQFRALDDERAIEFSRTVVAGKLANQRKLLLYFGKYMKAATPERYEVVAKAAGILKGLEKQAKRVKGVSIGEVRQELMGVEGSASRAYWEGVQEIIAEKVAFFGRIRRGATDEVNSMLNYGYGILYAQVWGAVVTAGLEPFAGFLHVDRPGKPSLVLDLVEEFRQPVVDRTVITHVNRGEPVRMEGGLLKAETRKAISQKILERLESRETYRGKKYQIRSIIQIQARNLAAFLRGDRKYRTFAFKW
ncbi:MAG: CRISPR-associated endonuclease Cas1 [Deltaproteobacteria bacterium]|nr:CRISPR-associated endonuclease Cas1 [Deltaproteobacteria bacterium]